MKQAVKKKIKDTYKIDDTPTEYTLLLDMNNIMKISISADKRISGNGLEYGMVFQSLLQIRKMLEKKTFDYVYAMYDGHNSGILRYKLYRPYKANRDKSYEEEVSKSDYDRFLEDYAKRVMKYSKEKRNALKTAENKRESDEDSFDRQRDVLFSILEELFIRQVMCEDVEGDDLIAYYVNHKQPNEKIIIYSGDRDLTQLISDDVALYVPQLKTFVSKENHTKLIGYPSENVLLKKILCGDSSDNIKGIKGLGESSLFKYFPKITKEPMLLEEVISESKRINEERISSKKKPLKSLENIVNSITDGEQGKEIYSINEKIISLKEPLLTDEAKEELNNIMYAPIDPTDREFKNIYSIVLENDMIDLKDEKHFSSFFGTFNGLIEKEKKRFKICENC